MKTRVLLVCEECLQSNYATNKSKPTRIVCKKYCKRCKKHSIHKENK